MTKEKNNKYYIYSIFNLITKKIYIGKTSNYKKRWNKHIKQAQQKIKYAIHWALLKYGAHNFHFLVLEECSSLDEANQKEIYWIKILKENGTQLYNETDGGEGSLGVKRFGPDNPNYGKEMKSHVKEELLKHRRKLTDQQINQIRELFFTNQYTQTILAKQFNISLTQIHRIVRGKSWGNKDHDEIITKKNLTIDDVNKIKQLYSSGNYTQKELGLQFNCTTTHINKIINGKKWNSS